MAKPASLNVIALISGGKDSLFSILHCLAQGHRVVALANLHPPDVEQDDMDSHMYQTVGHGVIPLYEEALGIPLFRQAITGGAVDKSKEYRTRGATATAGRERRGSAERSGLDETECLFLLLARVKAALPEADAVSSGAILSTYQRTRVESVAVRLGLTSLAYLWQYPSLPPYKHAQLLEDMASVGQDARIVKVASGGLDERWLWRNVADPRWTVQLGETMRRFGCRGGDGSVLGEGGEFETLAIDGPSGLWKRSIHVAKRETLTGGGGTWAVKLGEAFTRVKEEHRFENRDAMQRLRIPDLLDDEFTKVLRQLGDWPFERDIAPVDKMDSYPGRLTGDSRSWRKWVESGAGEYSYISNMVSESNGAEEQMQDIVVRLRSKLQSTGTTPDSIVFTTMLLRSMSDFTKLNRIYGGLFTEPNPPARATVACGELLGDCSARNECHVMLSVKLYIGKASELRGLHVQSRSYWAPANIGPYSQAISTATSLNEDTTIWLTDVAGQIPLIPHTMELVAAPSTDAERSALFKWQAVLALQHLWRIGRQMNVSQWLGCVAFLPKCGPDEAYGRARIALQSWQMIHTLQQERHLAKEHSAHAAEDDDGTDVWHLTRRFQSQLGGAAEEAMDWRDQRLGTVLETQEEALESDQTRTAASDCKSRGCFVVQVDELPRAAGIEWQSLGASELMPTTVLSPNRTTGTDVMQYAFYDTAMGFMLLITQMPLASSSAEVAAGPLTMKMGGIAWGRKHATVYLAEAAMATCQGVAKSQIVPCRRIWGEDAKEMAAVAVTVFDRTETPPSDTSA